MTISYVEIQDEGKSVHLYLKDIEPVDVMTISYELSDVNGTQLKGTVQNTIHNLGDDKSL